MDNIEIIIHHGGKFVNDGYLKYEGESETMYFDPDLWSYFVVVSVVKSLGYDGFKDLWFSVGCGPVLDDRIEALCDDVGVMHMVNLAHLNGQVNLYVVHTISQPDVIDMIEYNVDEGGEEVAPQVNEGGEGAKFAEGIDDGLRQQLDEGVGGDGERIEAHDVGQAEMTQVAEDEGERIEVDEGDVERTKACVVQEERIEVEETDVEGERTEIEEADGERTATDEVQEERIEGQQADVEAERTEADEVEVEVERIEVEDGDAERTAPDEVHEEMIEVEEADVEAERIKAQDGEGHKLDGEAYRIEVQDLKDIEVHVLIGVHHVMMMMVR
ncbi:hypothetical protein LR48_Vigan04g130900 [Vigna angularis]|uniref:PB1-like domain-containing protein n=1 Tax=Phaseolus angularis TaxID=3914 RepID=A0A0L9UEH6_PHAAN|nr:hypothetical protein LR48_Vigan04g130900 [Vigna angularis]